ELSFAGVQIHEFASEAGTSGQWIADGLLFRTATDTVVASVRIVLEGQDADVGSALETLVKAHQAITVSSWSPLPELLIESQNGGSEYVQSLLVRRVGRAPSYRIGAPVERPDLSPLTAAPPLLSLRYRGGTPALHRLTAGDTIGSAVGNTFGAAQSGTQSSNNNLDVNSVVEFQGERYALLTSGTSSHVVYRLNDDGTRSTVRTESATVNELNRTGLHVLNTGAGARLCFAYSTGTTLRLVWTDDGSTWTSSTLTPALSTGPTKYNKPGVAVLDGRLYIPLHDGSLTNGVVVIDAFSLSVTYVTQPLSGNPPAGLCCAHKGRVFYVPQGISSTGSTTLYEITGTSMVSRGALVSTLAGTTSIVAHSGGCLLSVGDRMLAIVLGTPSNASQPRFYAILIEVSGTTFTFTDVSDPLLPSDARTAAADHRGLFVGWVDWQGDPSVPSVHLWWVRYTTSTNNLALSTAPSYAKVTSWTSALSPVAADFTFGNFAIPSGSGDGGERIAGPTEGTDVRVLDVTVEPKTGDPGKALVTFKLNSLTGTSLFRASVWWGVPGQHFVRATLTDVTGPVGIALDGSYAIEGVPHDEEIVVEWDLDADGLADDDLIQVQVRAARTSL
ncbi:MAG: hypothetical protein KIT58_02480, partial [Planctomycetota bacterium]|nr:hypothetical protein [Planctomycetota bacterium]